MALAPVARRVVTAQMLADARARFAADARQRPLWTPESEPTEWLSLHQKLVDCPREFEKPHDQPRVFVARSMAGIEMAWCVARDVVAPETAASFEARRLIDLADADACACGVCGAPALIVAEVFPMNDFDNTYSSAKYAMCLERPHVLLLEHDRTGAYGFGV